jgi:hypothetical protein
MFQVTGWDDHQNDPCTASTVSERVALGCKAVTWVKKETNGTYMPIDPNCNQTNLEPFAPDDLVCYGMVSTRAAREHCAKTGLALHSPVSSLSHLTYVSAYVYVCGGPCVR